MDLETPTMIKESESTPTHNEPRVSMAVGKERDAPSPRYPPEHLLLHVVMTFTDAPVRLDVVGADVYAEGKTVWEALGHLVVLVKERIAFPGGEKAELRDYKPYTWFRFVPPDQPASVNKAVLADEVISGLNQLYEFKGGAVRSFLEGNPLLCDLLFVAYGVIRQHFGSGVEMALEVVADPEALGDKQLFVLIRTELPRKVAREQLAELDQAWWLNELPRAEGKMEIALE
jgi:hypothetical protein